MASLFRAFVQYRRPDRDRIIACQLAELFERELAEAGFSDLRFYVMDRFVTVKGFVPSEADAASVENFVRSIDSVRGVFNELNIPPSVIEHPSWRSIAV